MSQIDSDKLTQEQRAKFPEYIKEWKGYGLCTKPADRQLAEKGIKEAYRKGGLEEPERIIWTPSPLGNMLLATIYEIDDNHKLSNEKLYEKAIQLFKKEEYKNMDFSKLSYSMGYGQHDAAWLSFYMFFRKECGYMSQTDKALGLFDICKSASWFLPFSNVCFVSERHNVCFLENNVLHAENGPALSFPDGLSIYKLWGSEVPKWLAVTPASKLSLKDIMAIENSEVRTQGLKRFGTERIVEQGYGEVVEDRWEVDKAKLEKLSLPFEVLNNINYKLIDLSCLFSTKKYAPYLFMENASIPGLVHCEGVPPNVRSIEDALRFKFKMDSDEGKGFKITAIT